MKKLLHLIVFISLSYSVYCQSPNTFGGIALRVNDTTTYQANAAAAHSAGYYDIYFNNQATNDHFDVWNGSSYDHIFDFNQISFATETLAGKAELATQAETDTGTDDERIVTPLKLNEWNKMKAIVLESDDINNNASANTLEDVLNLKFPVENGGIYYFKFYIDFTSAATTTGTRWTINGPTTSRLNYDVEFTITSGASTVQSIQKNYTSYDQATVSGTGPLNGSATIEGIATMTADGFIQARFASEVSSSAVTAKAGSVVLYIRLN